MQSVSPVWTDADVENERIVALDQAEYVPLVVLPFKYGDGTIAASVRFRLTDEERKALAEGGDLIVTELTFGNPFTPIDLKICGPDKAPYE